LDLLLHLIKKNEVSITDIPIASITEQYLATLELMETLSLDVAGEFLVMAATLIHIKSRMLLPAGADEAEEDEGDDPRDELVRRLLDYQRFKEAADELEQREIPRVVGFRALKRSAASHRSFAEGRVPSGGTR
jgi:segregation and condensation protein A